MVFVGFTARVLVMITAYQYGLVRGEVLRKYLDGWVFPRARYLLLMYAVRNNYIKTVLHNDVIREYAMRERDFVDYLEGMSVELSEYSDELEELFLEVVEAERSDDLTKKILVADKLIHYQHHTGNFLDEDIVSEYWTAERIIDRLLRSFGE